MVGLIERLISNQGVSEPKDGRVFYLDFGDGNQSYGRLLNAIASQNIRQELNNLINETQPVLGSLSDLPLQVLKLRAAALVLRDLTEQGWIAMVKDDLIYVYPKTAQPFDSKVEAKASSRASGQYARQDQLQDTSVRNFINALELPSRGSSHQPITNLIADGRTLREQLEPIAQLPKKERAERLGQVIQPYLQLVEHDKRCEHTNIKLADIWRYFRFYWSLPQNSSPGRNLFFLVRDAGQPHHPVMAIAALGNVVIQLTCRDRILGWTPTGFMELIEKGIISADEAINCLHDCIERSLDEIHTQDLPISAEELIHPTVQTLSRLIAFRDDVAIKRKNELQQFIKPKRIEFLSDVTAEELLIETKSTLYQFKRAKTIAELLRARILLNSRNIPAQPFESLQRMMADEEGQIAIGVALRQARNRLSGSTMMELIVCGGVPPYSQLLSGKLACLMMLSPQISEIYEERYSDRVSIIASQMAGRPICRPSKLVYLGTTSLYAVGSSQYNRVVLPAGTLTEQSSALRYSQIGDTEGYGTAHLTRETRQVLGILEEKKNTFRRVNHVYGEGANPKMRRLSSGMDALGIAQADLLRHASRRLVFSIPLISNLERYLLEIDKSPIFLNNQNKQEETEESTSKIADFWIRRWLSSRLDHHSLFQDLGNSSPLKLRVSKDLPQSSGTTYPYFYQGKFDDCI